MAQDPNNLIWIDLEMTGLDTTSDLIIEIATIVTDTNLNILAEGPVLAIHQSDAVLGAMDQMEYRSARQVRPGRQGACQHHQRSGRGTPDHRVPCPACAGRQIPDVRQQHLPGPAFHGALHARAGKIFPLPQSGRQHGQGTGPYAGRRWWPRATAKIPRIWRWMMCAIRFAKCCITGSSSSSYRRNRNILPQMNAYEREYLRCICVHTRSFAAYALKLQFCQQRQVSTGVPGSLPHSDHDPA